VSVVVSNFSSEKMLHKYYYRNGSVEKMYRVMGLKGLDAKTKSFALTLTLVLVSRDRE
jgi:hypothetical protein